MKLKKKKLVDLLVKKKYYNTENSVNFVEKLSAHELDSMIKVLSSTKLHCSNGDIAS